MFSKQLDGIFLYQMPEDGGGEHHEEEHHDEGPPPEEHHEEEHHEPPAEEHHEPPAEEHHPPEGEHGPGDETAGPPPEGDDYIPPTGGTEWEGGPPADATAEQQTKWDAESAASRTDDDPHHPEHGTGDFGEYGGMGGEYGGMGGEYGGMGGEYGGMGGEYGAGAYGGEYGSFDPSVPPAAAELTDAPPGVQDIFAMADAGDITYAEAYEKAEEDFDWQSDAQEDMDGEYGDMATPDPTGELTGRPEGDMPPPLDDDIDDDDDDSDWDDDIDDHDHLVDADDEDDEDDEEMESPSGRM